MTKQSAVICDIDGTVALHDGIRSHYEYDLVSQDKPNSPIVDLVKLLDDNDYVLFVTGRPERARSDTIDWLSINVCYPDALFMRPDFLANDYRGMRAGHPDYRPDYIVKEEIYRKHIEPYYHIKFCIDDRKQVVDMWRRIGLTCLQVAEGEF